MLKQKIITSIIFLSFLLIGNQALASTTNGTIDPTYRYAWGENIGWIDFGSQLGNVRIADDTITGYAYGENIGFINLTGVTNDNEGNLSGYAWGENIGWVDFSQVVIDNDGIFTGQAYGENIGFITFNTNDNNKVVTDWRPKSSRSSSRGSSGGSRITPPIVPLPTPTLGCATGNLFNTIDGTKCPSQVTSLTPNTNRILKLTSPQMQGQDVKDLQIYLNSHNYNSGIVDGIFGNLTKQAVIKFQLDHQLVTDGIVGPITRSYFK